MFGSYKKSIEAIKKLKEIEPYKILTDKEIIEELERRYEEEEEAYAEHIACKLERGISEVAK